MSSLAAPPVDARDARIAELEAQLRQRDARVAALEGQVAALQEQVAAAQRAAKRQATPFARRKRNPHPQKPGRKPGQGHFASRPQPTAEQVTETKEAPLLTCPDCGHAVAADQCHEQFQIDIPPVHPVVTRFVTHSGACPGCAKRVHSAHPEQISSAHGAAGVVFGPGLKALAADLHHRFGASYGKIVELFRDAFGLATTRGALSQADTRLAAQAKPVYQQLVELIRGSVVVHVDETGWRIGCLSAWLWVFANRQITVYTIAARRGHEVIIDILGRQFRGVLMADCFKAYDAAALAEWLQQKCVAHLLRNLRELEEQKTGGAVRFARAVMAVLRAALALKASAPDIRSPAYEAATEELEARLDQLIDGRRQFRDPDNARMAARLRFQREHLLRFLYWAEVDATNNLAERQLRPNVVTRKTGGCNRTAEGADAHAILGSILATCRQQAVGILDYLIKLQQFGGTPPSLVPADVAPP